MYEIVVFISRSRPSRGQRIDWNTQRSNHLLQGGTVRDTTDEAGRAKSR